MSVTYPYTLVAATFANSTRSSKVPLDNSLVHTDQRQSHGGRTATAICVKGNPENPSLWTHATTRSHTQTRGPSWKTSLWSAACGSCRPVEPADFKSYVFPMLFWKWV